MDFFFLGHLLSSSSLMEELPLPVVNYTSFGHSLFYCVVCGVTGYHPGRENSLWLVPGLWWGMTCHRTTASRVGGICLTPYVVCVISVHMDELCVVCSGKRG